MAIAVPLTNFSHLTVGQYDIEEKALDLSEAPTTPQETHHIFVLDVSGSMWRDLDDIKDSVEKVLVASDFQKPDSLVSLLSYSSSGDCVIHFSRLKVSEVVVQGSPHIQELRDLRTRGLTGISQALNACVPLIQEGEATCITLHTDGYANDPSPYSEMQSIEKVLGTLRVFPSVFCNTVAHRDYCDFALLERIATNLSGRCLRVRHPRDILQAFLEGQKTLGGKALPNTLLESQGATYTAVRLDSGKLLLSKENGDLTLKGLVQGDTGKVFRLYKDHFEGKKADTPFYAFLLSKLLMLSGDLRGSKYALLSTKTAEALKHVFALASEDLVEYSIMLDRALAGKYSIEPHFKLPSGMSILACVSILNRYRSGFTVDIAALKSLYQPRGVRRLSGTRESDGTFKACAYKTSKVGSSSFSEVSGLSVNKTSATINLRLQQSVSLKDSTTGEVIHEVAGVPLDLKEYRNFTLVSGGQVLVPCLALKIQEPKLWTLLSQEGLIEQRTHDPDTVVSLNLSNMPLLNFSTQIAPPTSDKIHKLLLLLATQKFIGSLYPNTSSNLSSEQIEALKGYHVSPNLYFNPPTTNPYSNLQQALRDGVVDTRTTFKVSIGTTDILNVAKLPSANSYLQRRFVVEDIASGEKYKKPKVSDVVKSSSQVSIKKLSARTKLTPTDDLLFPLYEAFLGLGDSSPLRDVCSLIGVSYPKDPKDLERYQFLNSLNSKVSEAIESYYERFVIPLAFYVGSTGVLPAAYTCIPILGQDVAEDFPQLKVPKSAKEGIYYEVHKGVLLGVFSETTYYSTNKPQ